MIQETDKPKSITLHITREVIDHADRNNSSKCMIAQAVRLAGGRSTFVTAESCAFNVGRTRYTYTLPAKAAVELIKFDEKGKAAVEPFTVRLSANCGFCRPIVASKAAPRGKTKKKGWRVKPGVRRCVRRFHGLRVIEVPQ